MAMVKCDNNDNNNNKKNLHIPLIPLQMFVARQQSLDWRTYTTRQHNFSRAN